MAQSVKIIKDSKNDTNIYYMYIYIIIIYIIDE